MSCLRYRSIAARLSTFGLSPKAGQPTISWASWSGNSASSRSDDVDRRVVGVGHAEEELIGRVIELEEAAEVLLEPLIHALERLEDRDRRRVVGHCLARGVAQKQGDEDRRRSSSDHADAAATGRARSVVVDERYRHRHRMPSPDHGWRASSEIPSPPDSRGHGCG